MGDMADDYADRAELYEAFLEKREEKQEPVHIRIDGPPVRETDKGVRVHIGMIPVWLPKSLTTIDCRGADIWFATVPRWLAQEKDL